MAVAVSLAAFGGVYVWATLPALLITTALAVWCGSQLWTGRTLDTALAVAIAVCVAQLLPLPHAVLGFLSPHGLAVIDAIHLGYPPAWHPLSLSPRDTAHALLVLVPAVVMFLVARHVFAAGGVRQVCRMIPWLGLALALTAMVQATLSPTLIYGFWRPREVGAFPFGPFVNRNQCATWLVLAVSLCIGYLLAREHRGVSGRSHGRRVIDPASLGLVAITAVMIVALAMCASRSGLIGLAAGALTLGVLAMKQGRGATAILWIASLLAGGALLMALFGNPAHVILRFIDGSRNGPFDRASVWRDSIRVVADFWATGVGAGAYRTAMLYYQTPAHDYIFNQAHNHPLQVMVEGGVALAICVGVAVVAFVREAGTRLREETSALFWIRAGAAAGLAGVAVQSLWETGLRVPANAQLAAVAAAIVLHVPRHASRSKGDSAHSGGGTFKPRRSPAAEPRKVQHRQRQ